MTFNALDTRSRGGGQPKTLVEGVTLLYRHSLCEAAHGDGETVKKAHLPHQDGPGWAPVMDKAHLGTPLDVEVIVTIGRVQPEPEVDKAHLDRLAADSKVEAAMCILRVHTHGAGEPRGSENVLAAGIDEGEDRRSHVIGSHEADRNNRPQNDRVQPRAILLVGVQPRKRRRAQRQLAQPD